MAERFRCMLVVFIFLLHPTVLLERLLRQLLVLALIPLALLTVQVGHIERRTADRGRTTGAHFALCSLSLAHYQFVSTAAAVGLVLVSFISQESVKVRLEASLSLCNSLCLSIILLLVGVKLFSASRSFAADWLVEQTMK